MDYTIIATIFIPAAILYILYAGIIKKKNSAKEALSGIDVQLKKRANLIPNILKIAQKFMEHEKSLLTEITKLRSKITEDYDKNNASEVKNHLALAENLSGKMGQLMISVENYPDLKSDQTMIQAMQTYNEVEGHISAARRFYNSAVKDLNNAIEIFPGNIIASMINVKEMPFYEAEDAAKQNIDVSDFLK